jgi:hypothetical protein
MFNLASTSDKIQLITSAAGLIDSHVSFVKLIAGVATPDRKNVSGINTAVTTDLTGSPAGAGDVWNIKALVVTNRSTTVSNTCTLQHTDGTNVSRLPKVTLLPGYMLVVTDSALPVVYDSNMAIVTSTIAVDPKQNDFRLSGVSATPVMVADSTTLGTVYLAQYKGNRIALYDGSNWQVAMPSSEVSLAVTGRTTDLPFDVFGYLNAGVVTLEFLDWASATARATGLTRVDGIWTKTGDSTRRYLGSIRARSATTFHWVLGGTETGAAKMDLFNADNRVDFAFTLKSSVDTWTYTTATWRQANADADLQVEIMVGLQEETFVGTLSTTSRNSTISIARECGIGFDVTNANSGISSSSVNTVASINAVQEARIVNQPAIGRHFYAWLEISTATGTCTWTGDDAGTRIQSGMTGQWTC